MIPNNLVCNCCLCPVFASRLGTFYRKHVLEMFCNLTQGSRRTGRLVSSSPEPQQPSAPRAAGPKSAKVGNRGTTGTRLSSTPVKAYTNGMDGLSTDAAGACDDKAEMLRDLMTRRRLAVMTDHVDLGKVSEVLALSADEVTAVVQRMRVQATLP